MNTVATEVIAGLAKQLEHVKNLKKKIHANIVLACDRDGQCCSEATGGCQQGTCCIRYGDRKKFVFIKQFIHSDF